MERIKDIRNRAEAATEGPWGWDGRDFVYAYTHDPRASSATYPVAVGWIEESDAIFTAAAREDIPYLLDLVERARLIAIYTGVFGGKLARDEAIQWLRDVKGD